MPRSCLPAPIFWAGFRPLWGAEASGLVLDACLLEEGHNPGIEVIAATNYF
jgi:hypothetical protein